MSEMLYSILPLIIGGIFLVLGLLMNFIPKAMIPKNKRDSDEAIIKIKKTGTLLYCCTGIMVLIYLIP